MHKTPLVFKVGKTAAVTYQMMQKVYGDEVHPVPLSTSGLNVRKSINRAEIFIALHENGIEYVAHKLTNDQKLLRIQHCA